MPKRDLDSVARAITRCERCPRLIKWCREVARTKVRRFQDQDYWGKPVPGFGDPKARLLIVGLAPGAHGSNRTGRMFTGDSSGDWLYEALHRFGFANQPTSVGRGDGLGLEDCYITAAARCAPPKNRPTPGELATCRSWLESELALLTRVRVVITLGRIAHDAFLAASASQSASKLAARQSVAEATAASAAEPSRGFSRGFAHGALTRLANGTTLLSSYHPSRQNTNTGRLTRPMWHAIFRTARDACDRVD